MKWIILAIVLGYALYAAAMIALHPRFIYPFQSEDRILEGFVRVELPGGLLVQERKGSGPVILYFMGNAGSLSLFESAFEKHIEADRHIIALLYRGGGGVPGTPSERTLKEDALVAADYALQFDKQLIVQGFSLGTGLATHVAARRQAAGIILTAPYDRLCSLMASASYLPACALPFVQKWRSLDDARSIVASILVLHGSEDSLIPPRFSRDFGSLPNVKRRLVEGAGHNDIGQFSDFQEAVENFIRTLDQ